MQQVNPAAQSVLVPHVAPADFFAIAVAVAVAVALGVTDAVALGVIDAVAVGSDEGVLDAVGAIVTAAVDEP